MVELEYFQNALRRQVAKSLDVTLPLITSIFDGQHKKVLEVCTHMYRLLTA